MKKIEQICMVLVSKLTVYLIVACLVVSTVAKAEDEPAYLKQHSDFIQQVYSHALIGFAFERKCNFLAKSIQKEYEENLNFATEIFQGYLLPRPRPEPTQALKQQGIDTEYR